ncbi:CNT_collapsed_G0057090.mRNA.1.CDS.1 [Saccharomyces cerevisiae]|nr:CNT_HP2_G0053110.mRNA.1.CDS.1 [Saccharomyces cerevisiae]CAI6736094.1 CNT_HP2_G0053110.mRNA.1.CDS.1 [Saccharomyces cerevisiae]CAI6765586.1 CNT_HP1_G0055130.mRNA.1.CDS.1 [Saccharomyces cerevisiae]CAI7462850.1 CNT_collapsed_G0057090.mRNA.1.CDS.1 [Saccharomyces cerevisiae]
MKDLQKKSSVRRQITNEDDERYGEDSIHDLPRTIPNVNPYIRNSGFRPSYSSQIPSTRSLFNNYYNRSSANTVGNDTIDTDSVSYNGVAKFRRNSVDIPLQTHNRLEVRPIIDRQDYLWREIDALDDVKRQAQATELYDQFPPGFENKLMQLRQAHSKLLQVLRDRNAKIEEEQRREVAVATAAAMMTRTPSPTGKSVGDEATGNNMHSSSAIRNPNGPTVDPEEGKYIQELVNTIRELQ